METSRCSITANKNGACIYENQESNLLQEFGNLDAQEKALEKVIINVFINSSSVN